MSIHEAPDENDDDDGLSHSLDFYAKREEPRCVTMLNSDFFLFVYTPFGGEDWESSKHGHSIQWVNIILI